VTGVQEGNSLRLTFDPSGIFNTHINVSEWRWLYYPSVGGTFTLTKRHNGTINTTKYQERGYFLYVTHVSERDNGQYMVDCWNEQYPNPNISSPWSFVYNPEWTNGAVVATKHAFNIRMTTKIVLSATKVDDFASGTSSKNVSTGFDVTTVISAVVAGVICMVIVLGAAVIIRRKRKLLFS